MTSENEKAKANEKTLVLPPIVNESEDRKSNNPQHAEDLVLPPINILAASCQEAETDNEGHDETQESTMDPETVSLSSIGQLEQLTFPFFEDKTAEDSCSDGESDTCTEEASTKDQEDDERDSSQNSSPIPAAPRLKLDNLSWPSILQYMRESESLTSEYFSLNNEDAVESCLAHNKRLQQTVTSEEAERMKRYHHTMSGGNEERDLESNSMDEKSQICDFCGQNTIQISLLRLAEDQVIFTKHVVQAPCMLFQATKNADRSP